MKSSKQERELIQDGVVRHGRIDWSLIMQLEKREMPHWEEVDFGESFSCCANQDDLHLQNLRCTDSAELFVL